jgi:uncharacterized protein with GYD domain
MPKFMIKASYSADGLKGLIREGGTSRRDAVKSAVESAGGKLENFLYGFGDSDLYVIVDVPDPETAAAIALTIGASGALTPQTIALLTPEQVDAAVKKNVNYRPPGA